MLHWFRTDRTVVVGISKDRIAIFLHVGQLENETRYRRVDQVDVVDVSANVSKLRNYGFGRVGITAAKTFSKSVMESVLISKLDLAPDRKVLILENF